MKPGNSSASLRTKLIRTVLLACLILSLLPSFGRTQQSTPLKRVLVLYWYGKDFPSNVLFDRAFQASLQGAAGGSVEYYPEYLESDRFPGENQAQILCDYLRQKYSDHTIDVVVAGQVTMDFLLRHRDTLFPQTPIVFRGIKSPTAEQLAAGPGMTGIVYLDTHRKTLDLLLRLHPNTEQVFIISGTLERDKRFERLARKELEGYESRAQINYLTDLSPDELMAQTKRLPKRSVALYVWQQSRNQQGKVLESADILALIAASGTVPIYGMSSSHVGRGIVGGHVSMTEINATRTAEMALRIINGTRAQDIPVESAPGAPMFDWRQLRLWGIGEDKLPPGSIVRFKELTFWDHYKWYIIGVLALCALQALLISILLIERARRRRAKAALDERLRFETLLSELSADFTGLQAPEVDLGIDIGLKRLGRFLGVNAGAFLELSKSDGGTSQIESNTAVLGEPPLAGIPDEQRRWCMEQLRSGTTVNLPRVAEEVIGGKSSGSTGIKSLLAIPIAANGSACALTFATRESYREWREDLVPRLRLAGEIFASAVVRKKHEEALRESEERYRAFFELTAVGAGQASPDDGHFLRVNEAHCRITGHTREELLALKFSDITHPEDRDKDLEKFHRLIRGEVTEYTSEKRYLHKRGNPVWVQVDVSLVRDAQGRPLHTVAIVQDINARKRAQEALAQSEAFNRRIIESSNDCMMILDLEGSVLYLNPRGQQLLEIDDLASYRHTSWLDVWQGADKAAATLALQQAKDGGPGAFQGFCPTTGGTPKSWDVALAPMRDAEGTVERLLVVSRDISERKKAEALRTGQSRVLEMIATNEPLEDILASLACLMESHAEGMFCSVLLLDDDGLHVRHGAAPSLPESYTKCIDGISIGPQVGSCGTAMYRAEPVIVSDILEDPLWENYRELANAHGLRACWSTPIFSSQGQVLGSLAMYYREPRRPGPAELELIDVASHIAAIAIARRRAEQTLRASEERSRAILRAIPDAMFLMTSDGVYLDFHTTNLNELLVQPDQFLGKNMRDVLPPELAEKLAVSFRSALESNEPQSLEYALELKGQEQSYEARIVRTNGDQLLSVVRNITERKLAEEALRLSERRFRQLAENIRAVFFVTEVGNGTAPGRILYVSPAYETIWGRSCESLYRDTRSWLEAVHPDDRKRLEPELSNLTKGEFDEEFRIVRTGGKVRWVHGRVFPIRDERGKAYRVAGIVDDVTERKHAEEALRDREERLRLTCEAGRMGVWDWDIAANKVVWSKDIFSILGLEPLSIQPNYGNWAERIHPDDLSRVEEALNAAIRRKGSYQAEYRILWPDGTIRWTEGRGRSTYNEAGDCISMQGLMIDITERKQAEEALRESEERYRNVVETQTELICRNLPDTTLTFVNDAYCRYFNRTREELIGTKFLELIPEAVQLAVLRHVEALMESRSPDTSEHEHEVIRPDGSVGWQQWVNRKIFDPAGRVIEVQGIGRDITERKLAENALRESEERYRNVVETQTELICRYQCDTTLTFVNDAYCRYFGKTREQLIGTKFLELMPEEARPAAVTHVESLIANPRIETDEHEVIRADGTIGWQQWVDYAIRDADGTIMEMQAIGRDITERKRLEEDLQGREREFATLVENSPDIISRLDRDLRFLYVSPIVERVLGVPPQHFIGKTTREVGTPPHDWDAFESSCRQAFETGEIVDREFSYGGRHYHSRLIPEFGTGSSVDSVMCISEDTTERRRAEQELVQMSGRLLGLQEEERRRIARQLHDVTAQNLFATTINLARLQSPAVSSEVKEVLAECQSLCEQALQEIRTLSYILHPPILDQAGLVSALRWYIDGFSKRSGIDVGLVVTREFDRLPREVEADLFRIVQESLANVHRHSGSITARVRLEKQATQVVVQIRDEGHGMQRDKTRLEADESTLGVGIPGMRHRLRQLGGNLTIESNSHGTTVMATVPLRVERRERSRASHGSG